MDLPLYWADPDLLETDAIISSAEAENGVWRLVLEEAPFYPGGGGQPADRGVIDGNPLITITKNNGVVIHEISSEGNYLAGETVHCIVDGAYRRDSRQQHSGQHLISAALSLEGLETVSVHLGAEYTGIEVDGVADIPVSEILINSVLKTCDQWIAEDRKIVSLYLQPEELSGLELRRSLKYEHESETADNGTRQSPIRIIEIQHVDKVGCGGVHLNSTSSVGLILFIGSEKIRGHVRLNWLVGDRAISYARQLNEQGQKLQRVLSTGSEDTFARISVILEENRKFRNDVKTAEREIGRLLAESWLKDEGNADVISECIEGGQDRVEGAMSVIRGSGIRTVFLLRSHGDASGHSWVFFIGNSDDSIFDDFRASILNPFKGSGGGKPPQWRGRIEGDPNIILSEFRNWLDSR